MSFDKTINMRPNTKIRILLPGGVGTVEIDASGLVSGASGDPVIRVDVQSDFDRFGPARDGLAYEVKNGHPGPGVVCLVGRNPRIEKEN